jgi:hypothetical protein
VENGIDTSGIKEMLLQETLNRLDVPKLRKDTSKKENLLWLQRNLLINNGANQLANQAMKLINEILKEKS